MINAVYASSTFTSIAWTIQSLEPGRGLQSASSPPFADAAPPTRAYNKMSAGGPQIRLGAALWRARLITTKLAGHGALECLCTDLRIGAAATASCWRADERRHQPAAPPAGTSKVDIVLPGLTTLRNVAVTAAPDAAFRSAGPAVREPQFWTYWADPSHPGWEPRNWPTPVPRQYQLHAYRATVDTIVR